MNANCTRCSGRASALAPTSSSVTVARAPVARPGSAAAAPAPGRWMPGARLMLKSPAASAAPVPPAQTSACARPSATARAACTIEASGVARAARTGSGLLAIETGASTTSTPAGSAPSCCGGAEQQHARALRRGERRARGDLSRPEVGAVGVDRDDDRSRRACRRSRRRRSRLAVVVLVLVVLSARSRGRRTCRTPGTRGAAGAGCGSAGTRSARAP